MLAITGKQCKSARSLLKWNIYDLTNRMHGIKSRRLESFERGTLQLLKWESDELIKVFNAAGIQFRADLEVYLVSKSERQRESAKMLGGGARIVLDAEQNVVSDSSTEKLSSNALLKQALREEEADSGKQEE